MNFTKDEFDKLVKSRDLEVYTPNQLGQFIEENKDVLAKGEISDLDEVEKSEYNTLQAEIKSFASVEVYSQKEGDSRIQKSIHYIRDKQVEWDEKEIEKAEDGLEIEKARTGTYTDTSLNRKLERVGKKYGVVENKEEEK